MKLGLLFLALTFFYVLTASADQCQKKFQFETSLSYLDKQHPSLNLLTDCLEQRITYYRSNPEVAISKMMEEREAIKNNFKVVEMLPLVGNFAHILVEKNLPVSRPHESLVNEALEQEASRLLNQVENIQSIIKPSIKSAEELLKTFNSVQNELEKRLSDSRLTQEQKQYALEAKEKLENYKSMLILSLAKKITPDFENLRKNQQITLIKKITNEELEDFEKGDEKVDEVLQKINALYELQSKNQQKKLKISEFKKREALIKDYQIFGAATLQLLALFDSKTAHNVAPVINAGFKIALAINMLQSPNLITGSSLGPYGMIATAALSLMQSSQEESETRSILKGLRQLSEQINNLHKTVIEGFSRIDNHLFGMEIRIIEQLTKILKQNHNISVALGELEVELTKLREENKLIHIQELEAKRESLYLEFTNLVQECSKGFKKYSSCVEDFISTLNQFNNRENANFIGSKIPLIQNDKLSGNFPTHLAHFTKQINYYFDAGLKTPLHPNFYEYMRSNIILYLTKNLNYEKTERVDYLHFLLNRFDQRQESFFRELVVTNTDILVEQYINEYLKTIAQIEKGYLKMKDTFDQTVSAEIFQSERINSQNKGSFTQMLRSADGNAYFGESERSFRFYPITFSSSFSSLPVLP